MTVYFSNFPKISSLVVVVDTGLLRSIHLIHKFNDLTLSSRYTTLILRGSMKAIVKLYSNLKEYLCSVRSISRYN